MVRGPHSLAKYIVAQGSTNARYVGRMLGEARN